MAQQFEQTDGNTARSAPQTQTLDLVSLAKFEKDYGVDVIRQNGKLSYKLHGGSDQDVLDFSTSPTMVGLNQAGTTLTQRVFDKEMQLSATYHVSFSHDGEDAEHQQIRNKAGNYVDGALIKARAPKLNELIGIEAALKRSVPSQLRNDGSHEGVKFYFLTSKSVADEKSIAHFIKFDPHQHPAIVVDPERLQEFPIRQTDAVQQGKPVAKTMETFITHELVHNAQNNLGWKTIDALAPQLGWQHSAAGWLLHGKNQTYYALDEKFPASQPHWYLTDKDGKPVDSKHAPAGGQRLYVTNAQVRANAQVHPLTNYFINPYEELADELTMFRMGGDQRASIARSDCVSYQLLKSLDQSEIDQSSAPGQHLIRDWSGQLVDSNSPAAALVQQKEISLNCRQ